MNLVPLQQAPIVPVLVITYPIYEPPKVSFFEKKAATSTQLENNDTSKIDQIKKTMSQITNELTHLRL